MLFKIISPRNYYFATRTIFPGSMVQSMYLNLTVANFFFVFYILDVKSSRTYRNINISNLVTIVKRASWTSKDNVWSAPQMLSQSSQVDLFLFCCPAAIFANLLPLYLPWLIFLIVLHNKCKTNMKYTNINTRQADVIVFLYLSLLWHWLSLRLMIVRGSKLDTHFTPMPSFSALSYCASVVLSFYCPSLYVSNPS